MFVPSVEIKPYSVSYEARVRQIVMENIGGFYPGIEKWLDKETKKLNDGIDYGWIIVDGKDSVLGVAITGLERSDYNIAKLKTFYISKEISGYAFGVRLLKTVLNFWTARKARAVFVTFAEEELDDLRGFFDKFGFVMDGIQPQFYRPEKTEYVMSKTFVYEEIDEGSFVDFVRKYLLKMRGIVPQENGSEFLAHEDSRLSKSPRSVYVKIITERDVNCENLFKELAEKDDANKCLYSLVVSFYPLQVESSTEKIKVIDGYTLESLFYPLRLRRQGIAGIILPIKEDYARDLLFVDEPQRRVMKKRVSFTHERVYYTGKDSFGDVKRGGTLLFYLLADEDRRGVIGEAKIKVLDVGVKTEDAIKKYVERGVISTVEELKKHSKCGRVSVFLLTHVKRYTRTVGLNELRQIVPDVFCPSQPLTLEEINAIRRIANNDPYSY